MCDPLTLLSMAAMASGTAINSKQTREAVSGQNRQNQLAMAAQRSARQAEDERQLAMELSQRDDSMQALAQANPATRAEDVAAAVSDPTNEFAAIADNYNVPTLQGQIQGGPVSTDIARIVGDAVKRTKGILTSASTLSQQGTSASDVGNAIARMGGTIATTQGNRRGSINVAQLETSIPAAQVTRNASVIGDLLLLGGQLGMGFSGLNAGTAPLRAPGIPRLPLFGGRGVFGGPLVANSTLKALY